MRQNGPIDWQWTQVLMFQHIRGLLGENKSASLSGLLQDLFGIKKSAAYKKIRSETPLKMDEILILLDHFEIELKTFISYKKWYS